MELSMSTEKSYYDRIIEEISDSKHISQINLDSVNFDQAIEDSNNGDMAAFKCLILAYSKDAIPYIKMQKAFKNQEHILNEPVLILPIVLKMVQLYERNPEKKLCLDIITDAASLNEPDAQGVLATMYYEGNLVEKSIDLAKYWAKKAAENGVPSYLESMFPSRFGKLKYLTSGFINRVKASTKT